MLCFVEWERRDVEIPFIGRIEPRDVFFAVDVFVDDFFFFLELVTFFDELIEFVALFVGLDVACRTIDGILCRFAVMASHERFRLFEGLGIDFVGEFRLLRGSRLLFFVGFGELNGLFDASHRFAIVFSLHVDVAFVDVPSRIASK